MNETCRGLTDANIRETMDFEHCLTVSILHVEMFQC